MSRIMRHMKDGRTGNTEFTDFPRIFTAVFIDNIGTAEAFDTHCITD